MSYSVTSGAGAWPLMFFIPMYFLSIAVSIGFVVLQYISLWHLFKKMGFPGWKGIIPYYNLYVLFDRLWEKKKFWTLIILQIVMFVVIIALYIVMIFVLLFGLVGEMRYGGSEIAGGTAAAFIGVMILILAAAIGFTIPIIVLEYKLMNRLAKSFGKSAGFAVGLTFLTPIFMAILAFDKKNVFAPYKGNDVR